jgi:hypothetical protein
MLRIPVGCRVEPRHRADSLSCVKHSRTSGWPRDRESGGRLARRAAIGGVIRRGAARPAPKPRR